MSDIQIAIAVMVKNEEKRIEVTLNSVKKDVDGIILFDTGSNDNTVDIVKKYAKENDLQLHLLEDNFEDFATSRNKMLEFADSFSYDYLLLFDCNDELRYDYDDFNNKQNELKNKSGPDDQRSRRPVPRPNNKKLNNKKSINKTLNNKPSNKKTTLKELLQHQNQDIKGFMIHQKWHIGDAYDLDYFNVKIIKTNLGFKYKGSVHEYIVTPENAIVEKLIGISIYQDRVADNDGKTFSRWEKDLILLNKDFEENPNDSRTQYYLAQTYDCLSRKEEAFEAYKRRSENIEGFYEERFLSTLKCSRIVNDESEKIRWCLKAFELVERAEPLVEIAKIYRIKNQFKLSFIFANLACELEYPSHCVLNVDKKCYVHDRWHELSISCFYLQKFKQGKDACQKAIDSGYEKTLNLNNMSFYK